MNRIIKANRFVLFYLIYFLFASYILNKLNISILIKSLINSAVPIILYFVFSHDKVSDVFLTKQLSKKKYFFIFLFAFTIQPIFMIISLISSMFARNFMQDLTPFLHSNSPLIVFINLALMPAVFEETIFRGIVFYGHRDISPKKLFIINGLIFGACHLNFQQFFYAVVAGIVFCALVYYTNSIFSSMFTHFLINLSQVSMMYFSWQNQSLIKSLPKQTLINYQYSALVSFILPLSFCIPVSIWLFKKIIKNDDLNTSTGIKNKNPNNNNNYTQEQNNDFLETKNLKFKNIFTPSLIIFFIIALFMMCLIYNLYNNIATK